MLKAHSNHPAHRDAHPFWAESAESLLRSLGSTPRGLSTAEAAERRARFGPNAIAARRQRPLIVEVLLRFQNPLVLLLLAASVLSAVTGDIASFAIITTVVAMSVILDFVQEHRAGQAAERLRRSVAVRTAVFRDGHLVELPTAEIVPGDVVTLSAGSLVPADGVLLEARDLFVNQALLTGEPYPAEKHPGIGDGDAPGTAENAVFMGSSVLSGSGAALIVRTGAHTAVGEIGEMLHSRPPDTAFEAGMRSFGLFLLRTAILTGSPSRR